MSQLGASCCGESEEGCGEETAIVEDAYDAGRKIKNNKRTIY